MINNCLSGIQVVEHEDQSLELTDHSESLHNVALINLTTTEAVLQLKVTWVCMHQIYLSPHTGNQLILRKRLK